MTRRTLATVTSGSPLRVVVDGHSTDVPAKTLNGAAYSADDRVAVIVANPDPPTVLGVVT